MQHGNYVTTKKNALDRYLIWRAVQATLLTAKSRLHYDITIVIMLRNGLLPDEYIF